MQAVLLCCFNKLSCLAILNKIKIKLLRNYFTKRRYKNLTSITIINIFSGLVSILGSLKYLHCKKVSSFINILKKKIMIIWKSVIIYKLDQSENEQSNSCINKDF